MFDSVNGVTRKNIACLRLNSEVDTTFDPGDSTGDYIANAVLQSDGRIRVGSYFDNYQGTPAASLPRLLPHGTLDPRFNSGSGFESSFVRGTPGYFNSVTLQSDGAILVTGGFGYFDGVWAHGVVRLHLNRSLDTTFQMGGTDSFAAAINGGPGLAILPDGNILTFLYSNVSFLKDEPVPYQGIVRLNGDPRNDDRGSDK